MTIYPKIKGVPAERKKEHLKQNLTKISAANKEVDEAKKLMDKVNTKNENELFKQQVDRLMKED